MAVLVLVVGIVGGIFLLRFLLRTADRPAIAAAVTLSMTALMLAAIVLASVAGKYPFGGDLRQQYLLFPFLVLSAAVMVERLTALLPRRAHAYLELAVGIAIIWVSVVQFENLPKVSAKIGEASMRAFDRLDSSPAAIYSDQFNIIFFFIFHDDWQWSTVTLQRPIPGIVVYQLFKRGQSMLVFRDKDEWNADPDNPSVYSDITACLHTRTIQGVSTFTSRQTPPKTPFTSLPKVRQTVLNEAEAAGICVQKLDLTESGWYATFRKSGSSPEIARLTINSGGGNRERGLGRSQPPEMLRRSKPRKPQLKMETLVGAAATGTNYKRQSQPMSVDS